MTFPGIDQRELTTPRLRLRPLRPSDAPLLALYASDPRVARTTTHIPHPYPPGTAEAFVTRAARQDAPETVWALDAGADTENGLLGVIGLRAFGERAGDIGYWVAPAFWGAGFAREAVDAIAEEAVGLGLPALAAQVFQDNAASIKVLTRTGFEYLGEGESHCVARGAMVPTFRYRRSLADH